MKKYCRMGSDELPRCEFVSCLFAARANFPIDRLPITELRDHLIVAIQNTHLAVEIGTNHPFVPGMKVARHAESRIVLDGLEMSAVQREGLYTPIPAVCYHQARLFTAWIHEETVRCVKLAVAVSRAADFAEKLSSGGESKHMMGAIPVANVKISVRGKRYVS